MPASARRGVIPQGRQAGKATGFLSQLAERTQQAAEEMQNEEPEEDLNVLPFPVSQEIAEKWIQWRWEPCNFVRVYGILYTCNQQRSSPEGKGNDSIPQGYYEVQFSTDVKTKDDVILSYSDEEAKAIGQAMVSAANWINIWKDHAGMFIERDFMQKSQPIEMGKPYERILESADGKEIPRDRE
jgi:hypothetical protein